MLGNFCRHKVAGLIDTLQAQHNKVPVPLSADLSVHHGKNEYKGRKVVEATPCAWCNPALQMQKQCCRCRDTVAIQRLTHLCSSAVHIAQQWPVSADLSYNIITQYDWRKSHHGSKYCTYKLQLMCQMCLDTSPFALGQQQQQQQKRLVQAERR